eukprot:2040999-Pleurochrysis_carterae.AAC.1
MRGARSCCTAAPSRAGCGACGCWTWRTAPHRRPAGCTRTRTRPHARSHQPLRTASHARVTDSV